MRRPIETEPPPEQRKRVTMVVGMHRSGTSFLTGSLQQAGLELGKFSSWNRHNHKGNRENTDFVDFHDDVLRARGFEWNAPPEGPIVWTAEECSRARALVSGYSSVPHWGFKDPRATLLLDGWRQVLPHLEFVGIFRHPRDVQRSLEARSGLPAGDTLALWAAYNRRLLTLHRERPFPVLCFDEPEEVLLRKLDGVLQELGLTPVAEDRFFATELRHHRNSTEPVPPLLADLYSALRSIAR